MYNVEIYDRNLKRIAICEKAFNISYDLELNKLSTAEFTLLIEDSKNQYCKPFNFVKIYENKQLVDTFRIMPTDLTKNRNTKEIVYYLEHALGTLLDKVIFGYYEDGGSSVKTTDVLQNLLAKQNEKVWELDTCEFERKFEYSWENENLLSAIFSLPNEFNEDYMFTTDTTSLPFKLSLVKPSEKLDSRLNYERNLKGMTKYEDTPSICTRIYPLGYGEGINQLNISKVNPTGKYYIDADTIDTYGIVEKTWTDRRYTNATNLYEAALTKLNILKKPSVTYTIDCVELYKISEIKLDKLNVGALVQIFDKELNLNIVTRITKKSKTNIEKDGISTVVEISDAYINTNDLSSLYERAKINENYSQGATNINNYSFSSNCDPNYPAVIRFKIPSEAVNINKIDLSFRADKFRAFTKGAEASGVQTSSSSSSATTSSGGGQTSSSSSASTTSSGGGQTSSSSSSSTTTSGGGQTSSSSSLTTTTSGGGQTSSSSSSTTTASGGGQTVGCDYWTSSGSDESKHNHGIASGTMLLTSGGGTVTWSSSGNHIHAIDSHSHNMAHTHTVDDHTHNMAHTHTVADHTHNMAHTHTVANHTHNMAHTHTVDNHTHNMAHTHTLNSHTHTSIYGIHEASVRANEFTIYVDGEEIPLTATTDDFDIVNYLSKDTSGLIQRGWHEVQILPNDLCLINADIMVQVFVNSRGASVY